MSTELRNFLYQGQPALILSARRTEFVVLQNWLKQIAEKLGMTSKIEHQILIAADEVFTNIANYGYPDNLEGKVKIMVEFHIDSGDLVLTFTDSGVYYNPLAAATPDVKQQTMAKNVGGLGIFMVKKLMDSIEYHRDNGQNILKLRKSLLSGGKSA